MSSKIMKEVFLLIEVLKRNAILSPCCLLFMIQTVHVISVPCSQNHAYHKTSKSVDFEILRGLANSLLVAKKPDEAVQVLLASCECLNKENSSGDGDGTVKSTVETRSDVDPVQVDLFLGKAYSDWGHMSDAVSVYDQLIASHPDDFRGYLAKGIILKENGSIGDAERMLIQARFFAPDKAKVLVDKIFTMIAVCATVDAC